MNRPIQPFDVPAGTPQRWGYVGRWAFGMALALIAVFGLLMMVPGCATAGPASPPPPPAAVGTHLVVVNLTNYEWGIAINNPAGTEPVARRVGPQATVRIDLRGGDYVIEQTVITVDPGPELTRRLPVRLEPGQTYRWPLVTLLSDSTGDPAPDQPAHRHE